MFKKLTLPTLAILFGLTLIGCPGKMDILSILITLQPQGTMNVVAGNISGTLSVTAEAADGSPLTYQWYSNTTNSNKGGTAISGANKSSFTIPTSLPAGTYYYFCELLALDGTTLRTAVTEIKVNPYVMVTSITITPKAVAEGEKAIFLATVQPLTAAIKGVTWSSLQPAIATVNASTGEVTGIAEGKATIRATAKDGSGKTADVVVTVTGVLINGVVWATCNVDNPGTFAPNSEASAKFFQWNRKTAWNSRGSVSGWNSTGDTSPTWESTNDPSPDGWRVPTKAEFEKLLDGSKVEWVWTRPSYSDGYRFTDKSTGKSVFLPIQGYRGYTGNLNGVTSNLGTIAHYWVNDRNMVSGYICDLLLTSILSEVGLKYSDSSSSGYSIRAVRK